MEMESSFIISNCTGERTYKKMIKLFVLNNRYNFIWFVIIFFSSSNFFLIKMATVFLSLLKTFLFQLSLDSRFTNLLGRKWY